MPDVFIVVPEPDNIPPTISNCPNEIRIMVPFGSSGQEVTWTEPTATDNSGMPPTFTQSHQPGDSFSLGTTRVIYTFLDGIANQAQCIFTVTVGE